MPAKRVARIKVGTKKSKSTKPKLFSILQKLEKPVILFFLFLGIAGLLFIFLKWFVIVWVDNIPITRVAYYQQLEKRMDPASGRPFGEEVKDQMITEMLVLSEARTRNVDVSESEIGAEYKKTQDQVGKEQLASFLAQQNISEAEFKRQIYLNLLVRKMFGSGVKVTDEELNKYLEGNKDNLALEANNSKLDDKQKEQIRQQLLQQKISENFRSFLQSAQKSPRVIQ